MEDHNKIRLAVLDELHGMLARRSPKQGTFCDSYSECLRRIKCVAESLSEDIKNGEQK